MKENLDSQEVSFSVKALQNGDRAEFARLVDTYSNQIYRLALKMVTDPQDAEDVLQETFIKALRSIGNFEGRSSLSTWLYRIAVNEALMLLRKRRPDVVSMEEERPDQEGESEPVEIVDWCCLPEHELESAETRRFLDQAVQNLSPALRAVFVLRDIEGLPVRETAESLGISEVAVKTRLLRARLKMREELSVYFGKRMSDTAMAEKPGVEEE
jgi:RNA polymerase sigma-70 factor (ECF subfamily)